MGRINENALDLLVLKIIIKKNNFKHFSLLFKLLTHWGIYINLPKYIEHLLEKKVLIKERNGVYLVTQYGKELANNSSINELILSIDDKIESFEKERVLEFIVKYEID